MGISFGKLKQTAKNERAHAFNPEVAPHDAYGDFPHFDIEPLQDLDCDANYGFTHAVVGIIAAFIATVLLTAAALLFFTYSSHARDLDGHYATQNPDLHAWFDGLASQKGLCCSVADGLTVQDVDWDTGGAPDKDGHATYRVRLHTKWAADSKGQWAALPDSPSQFFDVPPEAVVKDPNRFGPAVVWPIIVQGDVIGIRCFLPGAGA